jgi:hypothetical protein
MCDAVLNWCSEALETPRTESNPLSSVPSHSLSELESLTVAQLKSIASELGVNAPSKLKKTVLAQLILDHESAASAQIDNRCSDAELLNALDLVWSLSASNGSPSTVRNAAALLSFLSSAFHPSTAAFAILSSTGVRARHIVDELIKSDTQKDKSSDAWWQNADALSVFEKFREGCLDIKSSLAWEYAVRHSISGSFMCSISVYSNHVTVTRTSHQGDTIAYTHRHEAGPSIEDLDLLFLDSPASEVSSGCDSSLWNSWGIFVNLGREMQSIIESSDHTLASAANAKTVPEKKKWWADRDDTDRRLQGLCRRLQRLIGPVALSMLIPPIREESLCLRIEELALQVSSPLKHEILIAMMHAAPVIGYETLDSYVDCSCIDSLRQIWSDSSHLDLSRWPASLVLPPPLHHFPWESMPALRDCSISRIICPSICLAAAAAHPKSVNTRNAYYVINPSGDLADTQNFFEPWFSSVPGWSGCAGSVPPANEALERISNSHLFM